MAPSVYFDPSAPVMEFLNNLGETIEKEVSKGFPENYEENNEHHDYSEHHDGPEHPGRSEHHGGPEHHGRPHHHGGPEHPGHGHRGPRGERHGRGRGCEGGRRGGGWGGRGGHWTGPGAPWFARGGPWAGPWGPPGHHGRHEQSEELHPDVDVFNTSTNYTVHVALPGAAKEDVGIHFDADKSELSISGVVHRPGDEEFLKTITQSERSIGAFDRKVKIGTTEEPALVEADDITAKLENGLLIITIPKKEKAPEQDRKKIEIQ